MWVVMRERKSIENVFFSFFLFYLLQYFLRKRDKREGVCGSGDGKELEKCRESFFFGLDRVCIYTRTLQYQCNLSLNCNEQYKEGIGYDSNTLCESNHSK